MAKTKARCFTLLAVLATGATLSGSALAWCESGEKEIWMGSTFLGCEKPKAPTPTIAPNVTNNNPTANGGEGGKGGDALASAVAAAKAAAAARAAGTGVGTGGNVGNINTGGTSVDASDSSSSSYRVQIVPPVTQPIPPSVTHHGDVKTVEVKECGPLRSVKTEDVKGYFFGLTGTSEVVLGTTDQLVPYNGDDGAKAGSRYDEEKQDLGKGKFLVRRYGHQPVISSVVVSVAGARQVTIGGWGSSGGAQGSGGASSSMGTMVTKIQLLPCEAPGYEYTPTPPTPKPVPEAAIDLGIPAPKVVQTRGPCDKQGGTWESFTDARGRKREGCLTTTWSKTRVETGTETVRISPTGKDATVVPLSKGATVTKEGERFAVTTSPDSPSGAGSVPKLQQVTEGTTPAASAPKPATKPAAREYRAK